MRRCRVPRGYTQRPEPPFLRVAATDSAGKDVVLKAYTAKPWMLFLDDITEEKSDWRNEYMRVYFGLNSVVLEQTE